MENEFYVTSVKEKCQYFDITCKGSDPIVIKGTPELKKILDQASLSRQGMELAPQYEYTEKMPGRKILKIKLESTGPYDIGLLNDALKSGKKVKLVIVEND